MYSYFHWNLDIAIFIAYLLINLSVGLYYSRGTKNIKEYAVGRRNFSTGLIVSTVVSTFVSGSGFFITLSKTYSEGLLYFVSSLGMALSFVIIAFIFIPRMDEFFGATSIAEAMGNFYGKNVRIIIAVAGTIGAAGSIAVQFKAFSMVFNYFLGIPPTIALFIAAGIVIIYSAIGGIRSIAYTDVLQFFTFVVVIHIVCILIWNNAYSQGFSLSQAFSNPLFDYKQAFNFSNPKFWQMIPIMLYFAMPTMKPYEFQEIIINRNIAQAKKAFLIVAICLVFMKFAVAWIPFVIYNINPNLQPNHLLSYVIDHYTYPGLKGFIIIGIASMAMSSADAYLNSSAVLFANDICSPLSMKIKNRLLLSRLFALFLGIFALIIAVYSGSDLLKIILTTSSFYMPIVTTPVFLTILGFRSTTTSVLIGMFAGLITTLIWRILNIQIDGIIFAMLINLLFLVGSHYLLKQPGGWVGIKDNSMLISAKQERKRKFYNFINSIKEFNFITFCQKNAPKNEATYVAFGIFCLLSTITIIYSTQEALLKENSTIILSLYQTMLVMSVCFITYPIWPNIIRKASIIHVFWNIGILYLLIFCSSFFCMVSKFGQLPIMIFTVNMIIAAMLIKWKVAIIAISVGVYCSSKLYLYYIGTNELDIKIIGDQPEFILMYSLLLIGTTTIIFFLKPKQQQEETTENCKKYLEEQNNKSQFDLLRLSRYREEFVNRLDKRCIGVFKSIHKQIITLTQELTEINNNDMKNMKLIQIVHKLKTGAEYLDDIIWSVKNQIKIKPTIVNLKQFLYSTIEEYQHLNENNIPASIKFKTNKQELEIDQVAIKNSIIDCIKHGMDNSDANNLIMLAEDTSIEYDSKQSTTLLPIKRNAIKLVMIFDCSRLLQSSVEQLQNPKSTSPNEIHLAEAHRIINAHYGTLNITVTDINQLIYSIIIPAKLKDIRPKTMDLPDDEFENITKINDLVDTKNKELLCNIAKQLMNESIDFNIIAKITKLTLQEINEL